MKKFIIVAIWASASAGFLYLTDCSKPLDTNKIIQETLADTIFVTDTVTFTDTLYNDTTFVDTLYVDTLIVDTLYIDTLIVDTLYIDTLIVDTLYVDTTFVDTVYIDTLFCARLGSHRQEIVWMLFNDEGLYVLEFQALAQRIGNSQAIVIRVDDQEYFWDLLDNTEMILEAALNRHATIRITSIPPHAYGRDIDICLRVSNAEL